MLIFLKSCSVRQPDLVLPYQCSSEAPGAVGARARHGDVVVLVDAELLVQGDAGLALGHQLVEVGARAEVVPDAAHDEHLDVVVDAGLEQQVGVAAAGRDGRDVELVRTVERDGGDPGGRILLVEDDLLGRWDIGCAHVVRLLARGMGVVDRDSGPESVTTIGSCTYRAPTPSFQT